MVAGTSVLQARVGFERSVIESPVFGGQVIGGKATPNSSSEHAVLRIPMEGYTSEPTPNGPQMAILSGDNGELKLEPATNIAATEMSRIRKMFKSGDLESMEEYVKEMGKEANEIILQKLDHMRLVRRDEHTANGGGRYLRRLDEFTDS